MKLKNNSVGQKVIHYVSTQGGRKNITLESNAVVEIADCDRIINGHEIEHKWVSIVEEINVPVDKMEEATKDVESYMSKSEEKSENKKSSKKPKQDKTK